MRLQTPFRESERLIRTLKGHGDGVFCCAFGHDGTYLLSGGDMTVRTWDLATGRELAIFRGHENAVVGCAVSPDGSFVVSAAGDRTLRIWDLASGEARRNLTGHGR